MNVELLENLEKSIRPGHHRFGDWNVALNMMTVIALSKPFNVRDPYEVIPDRLELGDPRQYDAACCMIGFTLFLTGKEQMLLSQPDADFTTDNAFIEAKHLLDVDQGIAHDLFFGCMSRQVTGDDAARIIRNLRITGKVDWMLRHR